MLRPPLSGHRRAARTLYPYPQPTQHNHHQQQQLQHIHPHNNSHHHNLHNYRQVNPKCLSHLLSRPLQQMVNMNRLLVLFLSLMYLFASVDASRRHWSASYNSETQHALRHHRGKKTKQYKIKTMCLLKKAQQQPISRCWV